MEKKKLDEITHSLIMNYFRNEDVIYPDTNDKDKITGGYWDHLDDELKTIKDKATDVCKEFHKIFPYCMISCHLREDLLYQFNIDFIYLNVRVGINVYIDYEMLLTGLPDLLTKYMYDRYIIPRIEKIKMEVNNAD